MVRLLPKTDDDDDDRWMIQEVDFKGDAHPKEQLG